MEASASHSNNNNDDRNVSVLHQGLVDQLKEKGHIRTPNIEAAFRAVPRHLFLPDIAPEESYRDMPIATKYLEGQAVSSSSQPTIMAIMLEQLQLEAGQRVLEIGAGTGYNAALMAHIVGETGRVVTIDIDEDVVEDARQHLATAGFERVQVICSDGGWGYATGAPYDRILLTVGASDITPAWQEQLALNGRLVLPLTLKDPQVSVAFERDGDHLVSVSANACRFITLRGAFAETGLSTLFGPEAGLSLERIEPRPIDTTEVSQLEELLAGPSRDWSTRIHILLHEISYGLHLWLALHEPDLCRLQAEGAAVERGIVPPLFLFPGRRKFSATIGLLETKAKASTLCLLMRPPETSPMSLMDTPGEMLPFELFVRSFGPDENLVQRLIGQIRAWDTAGRPSEESLSIKVYPWDAWVQGYKPIGHEIVIQKRWTKLIVNWV